jgi:hypothetical protein
MNARRRPRLPISASGCAKNSLKEIQAAVAARPRPAAIHWCLTPHAETVNGTAGNVPSVVYNDSENDLTDDVLKQLNAGAPIDTTAPAANDTATPAVDRNHQ